MLGGLLGGADTRVRRPPSVDKDVVDGEVSEFTVSTTRSKGNNADIGAS
jgi:hypothetical protein